MDAVVSMISQKLQPLAGSLSPVNIQAQVLIGLGAVELWEFGFSQALRTLVLLAVFTLSQIKILALMACWSVAGAGAHIM